MGLNLVAAPAETPVSLTEAKAHLRVEHSDEDTHITALIGAATTYLDGRYGILGRALVSQTWDMVHHDFPLSSDVPLYLHLSPVQSITSITYIDVNGTVQTMNSDDYTLDTSRSPARINLAYNASWPTTRDVKDAITVRFVAGFGDAADVPAPLKQAILLLIGQWYENRENVAQLNLSHVPFAVDALITPYKVYSA